MKSEPFVIAVCAILFSGCTTLSGPQCDRGDWRAYGRHDGRWGQPEARLADHEDACGALTAAQRGDYHAGWLDGAKEYCQPAMAFWVGEGGTPLSLDCPALGHGDLTAHWQRGKELVPLRRTRAEMIAEAKAFEEREKTRKKTTFEQTMELLNGGKVYASLPVPEFPEIAAREKEYGVPPQVADYENGKESRLWAEGGALAGTVVGFGAGHAVQGTYARRGWPYTVGELGVFALPVAPPLWLAAFVGLRIAESRSVYDHSHHAELGYPHLEGR